MTAPVPDAELPEIPGEGPRKIWRAGTLTYTTAGLVVLFCWLLWGDFAWSMKDRAIPQTVQLLLKKFGASDMVTGLLFGSLPPAIGIFLGPIIGYKSDRHRGRWGRRIPFLLLSTPVAVLAIAGLAFSPKIGAYAHKWLGPHSWGLDPSILISLGLFWMLFEFATVVANSVNGALINDVVPQPLLGRFYGLFRALSLIAGIIFNHWFWGDADTTYVWIFLGMGAIYGIGFTIMCLNVKEGEYPPQPPMDAGRNNRGGGGHRRTGESLRPLLRQVRPYGHDNVWQLSCAHLLLLALPGLPAGLAGGPVSSASSRHWDIGSLCDRGVVGRALCQGFTDAGHRIGSPWRGQWYLADRDAIA